MTPEQKQQILRDAPQGATHVIEHIGSYYRHDNLTDTVFYWYTVGCDGKWSLVESRQSFKHAIPLDSLREPEQAELKQLPAQQNRENILRLALEYISADPENHDAKSIVKDHIDTAKKALRHAASIPDENWSEEDERRMDVIGSNGNDGSAYCEQQTEYVVLQNGMHSDLMSAEKADEIANKWAAETPGKLAVVCKVIAGYEGKVEVERMK